MKTSNGKDLSPRVAACIIICMVGDQWGSMSDNEILQQVDVSTIGPTQLTNLHKFLAKESARVHKFLGYPYQKENK